MEPDYVTVNIWNRKRDLWPEMGGYEPGKRLWRFLWDLREGHECGFPRCCVLEFSFRWLAGFPKVVNSDRDRRRRTPGYIPCHFHRRDKE